MFIDPDLTRRIRAVTDPDLARRYWVWAAHVFAVATVTFFRFARDATPLPEPGGDWITPARAAEISSLSARWFYDHAHELAFVRKKGRRLLVSEEGLRRWLARP